MIDYIFECGRCGLTHQTPLGTMPTGWTDQGCMTLCRDCNTPLHNPFVMPEAPKAEPVTFVGSVHDHVRYGFMAVYMPQRGMVRFTFSKPGPDILITVDEGMNARAYVEGQVDLPVDTADAMADALREAALIARRQHPAQTGTWPLDPHAPTSWSPAKAGARTILSYPQDFDARSPTHSPAADLSGHSVRIAA